jgi:hypothetical protein
MEKPRGRLGHGIIDPWAWACEYRRAVGRDALLAATAATYDNRTSTLMSCSPFMPSSASRSHSRRVRDDAGQPVHPEPDLQPVAATTTCRILDDCLIF